MSTPIEDFYKELDHVYDTEPPEKVEEFLKTLIHDNTPGCKACFNPMELTGYNELGSLYKGQGQFDKAADAFEHARYLISTHNGTDSAEYATVLNNLAGTYRLAGDLARSARVFWESARVYEESIGTDNPFYCSLLNNLALVYLDQKDYDAAKENLFRALKAARALPDSQQEQAVTLGNLGSLYLSLGDYDQAEDYLNQCIKLYQTLSTPQQVHLAAAYNSLGGLYFKKGEFENAEEAYEKAKELTLYHFGKNHEYDILCQSLAYVKQQLQKKEANG